MPRAIYDDEFEKRIKPYDTDDKMDKALYNFAHNMMMSTSTADVVEVVRCEKCMRCETCIYGQYLGLDGFCSRGERREDEEV